MQRSYHLNDEDDTEVDKENVAQGRHVIVFSRSSVTRSVSIQSVCWPVSYLTVRQAVSNSARQSLTMSVSHSVGQSVT